MSDDRLVHLAREYCMHFHDGQFRKGSNLPYHTHPMAVAAILDRYGYSDHVTQCVALLHDVVEDTDVITGEIKDRFGYEIANGVFVLSKNTLGDAVLASVARVMPAEQSGLSRDELYKLRLSFARRKVKRSSSPT